MLILFIWEYCPQNVWPSRGRMYNNYRNYVSTTIRKIVIVFIYSVWLFMLGSCKWHLPRDDQQQHRKETHILVHTWLEHWHINHKRAKRRQKFSNESLFIPQNLNSQYENSLNFVQAPWLWRWVIMRKIYNGRAFALSYCVFLKIMA